MSQIPSLGVQLVHIQGPLKGEIQTFTSGRVLIGRHPDCDLQFPKDLVIISRRHAEIVREGNRFKLVDTSTNGTFVNGKPVSEAFLRDGDVITFAEGGPKVSFLTQVIDDEQVAVPEQPERPVEPRSVADDLLPEPDRVKAEEQAVPPDVPQPPLSPPTPEPEQVNVPFAIQYGPALKSFRSLPIVIGQGPACDFVIEHPAVEQKHAQIFFAQDSYWIKDLTGQAKITVNDQPLQAAACLEPDAIIKLAPSGPGFRFLGGGRLVELEQSAAQPATGTEAPSGPPPEPPVSRSESEKPASNLPQDVGRKASSLFKKFFS